MESLILTGAIEWDIQYDDVAWDLPQLPKAPYTFLDFKHQWRQGTSECVLYSVIWCVADNTAFDFTTQDISELKDMLPKYWRDVKEWMYLTRGWDLVVDRFKSKWRVLKKVVVSTYTNDFREALDKWYSVQFGSKIWSDYIKDINADWDIDIIFNGSTGHARRIFKHKDTGNYYIVENFVWSLKYNVIEVTPVMMNRLIKSWKLFYQSFVYYFEPKKTDWREKLRIKWEEYKAKIGKK